MARAEFTALGGGDCIGNSCYFFKVPKGDGTFYHIVVDCGVAFDAGTMDAPGQTYIPDLEILNGIKIDLIILTHAHADHDGYMPILVRKHPEAMVIMTEPTGQILAVKLEDVLKIAKKYNRAPLFTADDVEFLFEEGRIKTLDQGEWASPFENDPHFQISLHPSGHTRGAASVLMRTLAGNFMFSGDVSLHDLPTVLGATIPVDFRPDFLVTEMTYGGHNQPPRKSEEERFIMKVEEVVGRGGNVLIPAFAMGRATDVALVLAKAGLEVYVAGALTFKMARLFGSATWCDRDVKDLSHPNIKFLREGDYDNVINGQGNIVIASSGMMDFGWSSTFAKAWMSDPMNAVCFSGYLAEDTFGKRVSDMKPGQKIRVRNHKTGETESITLRSEVYEFCFSAHADQTELADWMLALSPSEIVGIHCERPGYEALSKVLADRGFKGSIRLGENGKTLIVGYEV